jgi:hypothetical protein
LKNNGSSFSRLPLLIFLLGLSPSPDYSGDASKIMGIHKNVVSRIEKKMRQNRLFLDSGIVEELIRDKFGSVDGLVGHWSVDSSNDGKSRERAAVYRWLQQGIPAKEGTIFSFCALLDADPVSLIDYNRIGFFSKFYQIRKAIQIGLLSKGPISPIYEMYMPSREWPSNLIASKYYGRNWHTVDFDNKDFANEGQYALIEAIYPQDITKSVRCIHISYRRTKPKEEMWRPYGWVVRFSNNLRLYSESGDYQTCRALEPNNIKFRTYFGGRAVEFRLASLHAFEYQKHYPVSPDGSIGFEW